MKWNTNDELSIKKHRFNTTQICTYWTNIQIWLLALVLPTCISLSLSSVMASRISCMRGTSASATGTEKDGQSSSGSNGWSTKSVMGTGMHPNLATNTWW